MKKLLILLAIALMAAPAFAAPLVASGPTPLSLPVPVKMLIDKTVTLSVDPPEIMLTAKPVGVGVLTNTYVGYTTVTMTHNFPVTVSAAIAPVGPSLGPLANYSCGLANTSAAFAWGAPLPPGTITYNTPAPAPGGRGFFVGAKICNVNIDFVVSDPAAQQVAIVLLTVTDLL
jgi:hypothetical protein